MLAKEINILFIAPFKHMYLLTGIAKHLTTNKVPTPAGKDIWQSSTVLSIIKNEKYKGAFLDAFNSLLENKSEILEGYEIIIQALTNISKLDNESIRFEDGEFRKRVQFMYAGKLMKIKFEFIIIKNDIQT